MKNLSVIFWIVIALAVGANMGKKIAPKTVATQNNYFAAIDKAMAEAE